MNKMPHFRVVLSSFLLFVLKHTTASGPLGTHRRALKQRGGGPQETGARSSLCFDGSETGDWEELAWFARSASLTYYDWGVIVSAHEASYARREAETIRRHDDGLGIEAVWGNNEMRLIVREVPEVGMRYLVRIEDERYVHIAVKGSDNARNFRDDVDYAKVLDPSCDNIRLHRGFKRVTDAIWEDLVFRAGLDLFDDMNSVDLIDDSRLSFELTGHSLGGGAATILAMRLVSRGYLVNKVVSFGAPKVTNARGAHHFASRIPLLRVLTDHDPVPTLPSMDLASHVFGFYKHFGHRLVLYEDDEEESIDNNESEHEDLPQVEQLITVWLCPTDSTGVPRKHEKKLGGIRYATRPDPRWLGAEFRRQNDGWNFVKDTNIGKIVQEQRLLLTARLKDFALWHLDESFLFHAHHVSPIAHTMDAYEAAVQTRRKHRRPANSFSNGLTPHQSRRNGAEVQNKKKRKATQSLRTNAIRRGPFLAFLIVTTHRAWKWRKILSLFKPKYLILSLLFVGWTGSGGASSSKHPTSDDDDDDDISAQQSSPHRTDDTVQQDGATAPLSPQVVTSANLPPSQAQSYKKQRADSFFAAAALIPSSSSYFSAGPSIIRKRATRGSSSSSPFAFVNNNRVGPRGRRHHSYF